MICTPQALVDAAICYTKLSKEDSDAAAIWSLCQWANAEPTPTDVHWEPETAIANWTDSSGPHVGDLAAFLSTPTHPSTTSLSLDSSHITEITGISTLTSLVTLLLGGNPLLTSVDLTGCTSLQQLVLDDDSGITTLDISPCIALVDFYFANGTSLSSLTIGNPPNLATFSVNNSALTSINLSGFNNLTFVAVQNSSSLTTLTLTNCTALTTLDASFCPALTGITGDSTCTALASINIANSGVASLTLGGAANMTQIDMSFCSITSFIANSLQTISGSILMDVSSLTTISLPNLVSSGSQIALTSSPFGPTLSLPSLVSVGIADSSNMDLVNNTSLVTISATNLVTIANGISCNGCTSLDTIALNAYLPSIGTNIQFTNCALLTGSIDLILARCVASAGWGFGGEFVDLSGGTNLSHALWSAAALADEATLVGRGSPATVVSNP